MLVEFVITFLVFFLLSFGGQGEQKYNVRYSPANKDDGCRSYPKRDREFPMADEVPESVPEFLLLFLLHRRDSSLFFFPLQDRLLHFPLPARNKKNYNSI